MNDKPPVVLIHGLWMNARSWEHWVERYERARALRCSRRPGPASTATSRRCAPTPPAFDDLGVAEIVDHYEDDHRAASTRRRSSWATRSAALFTQILLDRGLGAAGVAIDSARR